MKGFQPDDWYRQQLLEEPDLSAGLGATAYSVSVPQPWGLQRRIEVLVLNGGKAGAPERVSAGGDREYLPRFSPDGGRLAFLSNALEGTQLWVYSLKTASLRRLSSLAGGVEGFAWSPDGTRLALLAPGQPVGAGFESGAAEASQRRPPRRLFVLPSAGGEALPLQTGDTDPGLPAWSPDGEQLAFAGAGGGLFILSVPGGDLLRLTEGIQVDSHPAAHPPLFTPQGELLFAGRRRDASGRLGPKRFFSVPARGGEARCLWPGEAPCYEAGCLKAGVPAAACLSEDGSSLYFLSGWQGACAVFRLQWAPEPGIVRISQEKACWQALSGPRAGRLLALRRDPASLPLPVLLDQMTGREQPLADSNPWLRERKPAVYGELWVDTLDGKGKIHGFALPPRFMEPGRKYPVLLDIHDGPEGFFGHAFSLEHQLLAEAGLGVLGCNPRGSSGYGEEHADRAQAYDGTAVVDLLQFLDEAAKAFPWIDPTRVGVTGAGYGGTMAGWLITMTGRFRAAAIRHAPVNELISPLDPENPRRPRADETYARYLQRAAEHSPTAHALRITAPLLILHGLKDPRLPADHARQLQSAIKEAHPRLPVRLVLFPGAFLGAQEGCPAAQRLACLEEMKDWFLKYL